MKRFILTFAIIALITSCKTQQCMTPLVIRDSISVTYRQGKEQPFFLSQIEEQPASPDAIGAAIESRKNSSVPTDGTVGVGATQGASVFEGLLSQRTNKKAVPPTTTIRVDTVYIERWHSQTGGEAEMRKGREVGDRARDRPKPFYRHCTIGFWLLLFLLFGRIAFRILKAIYH